MVLCIVYTIFTNVTNLHNIFLIYYDYLDFCYCTIFGSIKFAVESVITSTLYFTKSVIYLRDIMVSTKELFQIRLTLISNSSDCENMIALLVFSFILLFLLLPHKRDLRLKACISTIFLFFSISHFSSKKPLSSFPENTLKNISTSEFFTYESIKASNFASMVCFNQELNLFCFSNLRYRNNKTYFRLLLLLSGDISLNPGPINGSQQHNYDQWAVFKKRGLHFAHIDFNINLFSKQKYIFHQTNTQSMSPEVKNYFQFCSLYDLEQLIKSPTRVTCSTSSLIDHILTTFPERVSQQGIIDVGLFDPQLLYCT